MKTRQKELFEASQGGPNSKTSFNDIIAIGTVVDTSDPLQWGRVRAIVPSWGDSIDHKIEGLPWAMYVSPFGGETSVGTRGSGIHQTDGGIAYGMWAIPKVGAQVVLMSLDEDHQQRLYLGCVFDPFINNTIPHGRWMYDDHPAQDGQKNKAAPYGPFSSADKLIQPLANNLILAFGPNSNNFEWQTRAADYSAGRIDVSHLHLSASNVQDDKGFKTSSGWVSTQGYQTSRIDPSAKSTVTDKNYDSQVYSLTSPGFHSISMDDRMENCRMRFRTTSGHQILLDDTNERVYISTALGKNWIELDQAGNIDIFTANKVNIHAIEEINLTSDKSIRMYGKEGVHIHSDKDVRITAAEKMHIKSNSDLLLSATGSMHISASDDIIESAANVHINGPTATLALSSFYTNRVPMHEPYARCMTKVDTSHEPEFDYDDPNIGKMERGRQIPRGIYWRR
ncbi:MAG: phage baseplate assembly protein V [Nitrososphaeraceae archaeon]